MLGDSVHRLLVAGDESVQLGEHLVGPLSQQLAGDRFGGEVSPLGFSEREVHLRGDVTEPRGVGGEAPSRAVLMHAYADRFTHDYFFDRDYPDVSVLENIYSRLVDEARPKEMVQG